MKNFFFRFIICILFSTPLLIAAIYTYGAVLAVLLMVPVTIILAAGIYLITEFVMSFGEGT